MAESTSTSSTKKYWVTGRHDSRPIITDKQGPNSLKPLTVPAVFQETLKKHANRPSLHHQVNGKWYSRTWKQYYEEVARAARSLISLGFKAGDAASIIGFNSAEWLIADLAAIFAGGIAAGIYTTNGPEACHYIADHSESVIVFVENNAHLKKFMAIKDRLPRVKNYVIWAEKPADGLTGVLTWDEFMKLGDAKFQPDLDKRIAESDPGKCCTLIYTSGTTGNPKACMMSHDNMVWTAKSTASFLIAISEIDRMVSYLPLSHVAAQMLDIILPVCTGASLFFAQPDALRGSLGTTLKEVKPTVFLGVPRVWEKIEAKLREVIKSATGFKKSLLEWATSIGKEGNENIQKGEGLPWGWTISDFLVLSKIKTELGLDQCKVQYSAAAPINRETLDFFNSVNIPIFEIYGMSECTGPQTVTIPGKWKTGATGTSIPGTDLKLDQQNKDGEGEICYRGRHIFMGYLNNDAATAETIDAEGYLHSGDLGKLDKDGFLSITGRIKELIITAGGENIPPVLIEAEIKKELSTVISNIMVIGDRKKFLSAVIALITKPNPNAKPGDYQLSDELADPTVAALAAAGSNAKTVQEAQADPKVIAFIKAGIDRYNKNATSRAQCVQKFEIIGKDFSIEGDELTPTLKLKRRIVLAKYNDLVEKMYAEVPGSPE